MDWRPYFTDTGTQAIVYLRSREHVNQHSEEMAGASGKHKTMPDGMAIGQPFSFLEDSSQGAGDAACTLKIQSATSGIFDQGLNGSMAVIPRRPGVAQDQRGTEHARHFCGFPQWWPATEFVSMTLLAQSLKGSCHAPRRTIP
jgi:hypothetical protein